MVDGDAEALAAADAVADGDAEALADAEADGDAEALADAEADGDAKTLALAYAVRVGDTLTPGDAVADGDAVAARTAARDPAAVNAISPFIRVGVAMAPMRELGMNMEISFLSERGPEAATTRFAEIRRASVGSTQRENQDAADGQTLPLLSTKKREASRAFSTDIEKEVIISGLAHISRCRHL
jgi:hypothetical protein